MYPGFLKQSNLLHERGPLTVIRTKRSLTSGTWLHGKFLFHHCGVKSNFLGFRISLTFGTWLHRKFLFHCCGVNSSFIGLRIPLTFGTWLHWKFLFHRCGVNLSFLGSGYLLHLEPDSTENFSFTAAELTWAFLRLWNLNNKQYLLLNTIKQTFSTFSLGNWKLPGSIRRSTPILPGISGVGGGGVVYSQKLKFSSQHPTCMDACLSLCVSEWWKTTYGAPNITHGAECGAMMHVVIGT